MKRHEEPRPYGGGRLREASPHRTSFRRWASRDGPCGGALPGRRYPVRSASDAYSEGGYWLQLWSILLAARAYYLFVALIREVLAVTLADTGLTRGLLVSTAGISATDAVHSAVIINNGVERITTFDRGFDRIGRVVRVEL